MQNKIITGYQKHPTEKGVFIKHFFSKEDTNGILNNLEVRIEQGCQISPHRHENSSEFYYVVRGSGMFLVNGEWEYIHAGEAMVAPINIEHGVKNTSSDALILLSTFIHKHGD
jgi:quercetin dioxygenase-like cupin family protein